MNIGQLKEYIRINKLSDDMNICTYNDDFLTDAEVGIGEHYGRDHLPNGKKYLLIR